MPSAYYRRNLPHLVPDGEPIFITWRLHGSLPESVMRATENVVGLTPGERFARNDAYLDGTKLGPHWLVDDRIAEFVCATIERGACEPLAHYILYAYVVMPNHVHLFATPRVALRKMMQGLKSVTARYANQILSRERIPFWQQESYDHVCRNEAEFAKICVYIAMNPVKARFVDRPEGWKWSSVARRRALGEGATAGVESVENATN